MCACVVWLKDFLIESVSLFTAMAPYLLIGFLLAGLCHVFFPPDLIFRHLGKSNFLSVFKSALFGVPLPLCSCGVIPAALTLRKHRASPGATMAFLISTPQTGVDSIIATGGLMGPIFMIFRPLAAFVIGVFGGLLGNAFLKDLPLHGGEKKNHCCDDKDSDKAHPWIGRLKHTFDFAFREFLDEIAHHLVIGILIAALIAVLVPDSFFANIGQGFQGMLLVLIIAIPMYVCATASIPVALVMLAKGVSPGVAFVFLAAGPAANAASLIVLGQTLGKKFLFLYLLAICVGSTGMGCLLDYLYSAFKWSTTWVVPHVGQHEHVTIFFYASALVLFVLIVMSLIRRYRKKSCCH